MYGFLAKYGRLKGHILMKRDSLIENRTKCTFILSADFLNQMHMIGEYSFIEKKNSVIYGKIRGNVCNLGIRQVVVTVCSPSLKQKSGYARANKNL
jgi:hypothetical protein